MQSTKGLVGDCWVSVHAFSRFGKRKRRGDKLIVLLLSWCTMVRHRLDICIAIHENVIGFDEDILRDALGDIFDIRVVKNFAQSSWFLLCLPPTALPCACPQGGQGSFAMTLSLCTLKCAKKSCACLATHPLKPYIVLLLSTSLNHWQRGMSTNWSDSGNTILNVNQTKEASPS